MLSGHAVSLKKKKKKNISSISIPSHQAMQAIALVYEIKPLQNAFKRI